MNKKPKPRKKPKLRTSAARQAEDIRQVRREAKRFDKLERYVVYERPFRGVDVRFYLDVSEATFRPSVWPQATLFKEEHLARLVAREYSVQRQRRLYVALVTIKVSGR